MNEKEKEKLFRLIKTAIQGVSKKVIEEVPDTGRALPSVMFVKSKSSEWMPVISVETFGKEAHQRNLTLGITNSFYGKRTSYVMKTGTKAEILEYLNDEKTAEEMYNSYLELYHKVVGDR